MKIRMKKKIIILVVTIRDNLTDQTKPFIIRFIIIIALTSTHNVPCRQNNTPTATPEKV